MSIQKKVKKEETENYKMQTKRKVKNTWQK